MRQVWLHSNRRIAAAGLLLGLLLTLCGGTLAAWGKGSMSVEIAGGIGLGLGFALLLPSLWVWFRPRLAYRSGVLWVYVRTGGPLAIPIEQVEVFFLGQDDARLPWPFRPSESQNVVIRLGQAARSGHRPPIAPRLGEWLGDYLILRGPWCEPITKHKLEDLNRRLVAAQRVADAASVRPSIGHDDQPPPANNGR